MVLKVAIEQIETCIKFKMGDRVKVINPRFENYNKLGTVHSVTSTSCNVLMDYGSLRTYKFANLQLVENNQEEQEMAITGDFKVAKVKFLNGTNINTEYEYAMFDDYEVGDTVVVASAHHGLGIAKISAIITKEQAITKAFEREIVSRVNMEAYETRKKNRNRLHELKKQMDDRVRDLNQLALFEMLAAKDDELSKMLGEYKLLIGV